MSILGVSTTHIHKILRYLRISRVAATSFITLGLGPHLYHIAFGQNMYTRLNTCESNK